MKNTFNRPKWGVLYLSTALVLGLFWLEGKTSFTAAGHTWIEVGLTLILYGLVVVWLKANQSALLSEECE